MAAAGAVHVAGVMRLHRDAQRLAGDGRRCWRVIMTMIVMMCMAAFVVFTHGEFLEV